MVTNMEQISQIVQTMKGSTLCNYVIAGLDSSVLNKGQVRLFENHRDHQDSVTPHSHRFNFTCLVLKGYVVNRLWEECDESEGDFFQVSALTYKGSVGEHSVYVNGRSFFNYRDEAYSAGSVYSMSNTDIHSIRFSRGAEVLFFEGPTLSNTSIIIEPVVNGIIIPTCRKEPYMFVAGSQEI